MYNLENPQKWKNFIPSSNNLNRSKNFLEQHELLITNILSDGDKLTQNDIGERNWVSSMVDLEDCHPNPKFINPYWQISGQFQF